MSPSKVIVILLASFLSLLLTPSQLSAQGFASVTPLTPHATLKNTGEKPQSKVWTYDGKWWSVFTSSGGTYVWRLDGTAWTSVLKISTSTATKADCKVVDNVVHILLWKSSSSSLVSVEYVPASSNYKLWPTRTSTTSVSLDSGVEIGTIDIDGNGRMWLASDGKTDIRVRWSDFPYTTFSDPIIIATGVTTDDICVVTTLPVQGQVGVLWSNQNSKRFGFKTHTDGANPSVWSTDEVPASQSAINKGNGMGDDHMNVALGSDGTLYCAVKTSYDTPGYPRLSLLKRHTNGTWDNLYEVTESGTRAIVILNETINKLKIIYTSVENGGDILYKESSMSTISFSPEMMLISGSYNNATSTKNNYDSDIVILASTDTQIVGILGSDNSSSTIPSAPILLSPANLTTGVVTNPTLSWNTSTNATAYRVQVSTVSSFATKIFDQSDIAATSVQLSALSNNTVYYWRVNASNADGTSGWSTVRNFTTIALPPSPPSLLTPVNLDSGVATNPTLNWNASVDADSYRVQVSTVSNFATKILDQSNILTTSTPLSGLSTNTLYYWRVLATNSGGSSGWSATWNFTTVAQPPAAPALQSPTDLATEVASNPTLNWIASANATSYHVQVSTVSNFTTTVFDQSNIVTTSALLSGLSTNTLYYWRALATNSTGSSAWSATWSFTTISQPPSVPTLISPTDLLINVATNPTLSWSASTNANSYQVQASAVSNFSTTVFDQSNIVTTSVPLAGLSNSTLYYWRVRATNAVGSSGWSAVWSFTTISASSNALVGHWKMNEGSGTTLIDDSGFGNNAVTSGSPVWVTGVSGQALKLNGTNQFATAADANSLDASQAITVAAWIQPEKQASQYIIQKGLTVDGYTLSLLSTGKVTIQFNQITSTTAKLNSNTLYPFDGVTWMHVAATYNGSTIRIYINGVEDKSITFGTPLPISTNQIPLRIGSKNDGGSPFKGTLDDVRVYNYTLTGSEILGLVTSPESLARVSQSARISSAEVNVSAEKPDESIFTINAYPNPADNFLSVEFQGASDTDVSISIADTRGRIYFNSNAKVENNKTIINLKDLNLSPGLHILVIRSAKYSKVIKFIKT